MIWTMETPNHLKRDKPSSLIATTTTKENAGIKTARVQEDVKTKDPISQRKELKI